MEGKQKFVLHLCKGCIEDLKEYNPWKVNPKDLSIVEVSVEECDNSNLDTQPWVERNKDYQTSKKIRETYNKAIAFKI